MMRSLTCAAIVLLVSTARADPPPGGVTENRPPPDAAPMASPEAALVPVAPPPAAAGADTDPTTLPLAGYDGNFFLRDPHNWLVLCPKGRLQIDTYTYPSPGAAPGTPPVADNSAKDNRPKNTIFARRVRPELQGTVLGHFDFHLGGEFGTVPGAGQYGTLTEAYVIVNYLPFLQLQVGQYDAPFTLENRTSDKYFDFMERSMAVRDLGIPANKDDGFMFFGSLPTAENRYAYYSVGIFNGDGQNFKAQDGMNPAIMGRAIVSPLAGVAPGTEMHRWLRDMWVGGSFWYQSYTNLGGTNGITPNPGGAAQNDLAGMTTQGAFSFFSANYANGKDAMGNAVRSHLSQNGKSTKWALEANVPVLRGGLRAEYVHASQAISQYNDTSAITLAMMGGMVTGATASNVRANLDGSVKSTLTGNGWYAEAWWWVIGDPFMIEAPGFEPAPHYNPRKTPFSLKQPGWGLMVALKYEHLDLKIDQFAGANAIAADPAAGNYAVDAIEVSVNGWASKHVRLTLNYVANFIGGFSPRDKADATNQDAANFKGNLYYGKVDNELLFRIGINL